MELMDELDEELWASKATSKLHGLLLSNLADIRPAPEPTQPRP